MPLFSFATMPYVVSCVCCVYLGVVCTLCVCVSVLKSSHGCERKCGRRFFSELANPSLHTSVCLQLSFYALLLQWSPKHYQSFALRGMKAKLKPLQSPQLWFSPTLSSHSTSRDLWHEYWAHCRAYRTCIINIKFWPLWIWKPVLVWFFMTV